MVISSLSVLFHQQRYSISMRQYFSCEIVSRCLTYCLPRCRCVNIGNRRKPLQSPVSCLPAKVLQAKYNAEFCSLLKMSMSVYMKRSILILCKTPKNFHRVVSMIQQLTFTVLYQSEDVGKFLSCRFHLRASLCCQVCHPCNHYLTLLAVKLVCGKQICFHLEELSCAVFECFLMMVIFSDGSSESLSSSCI